MIFTETPLPGAYLIDIEPKRDERGFFSRIWCADELGRLGLNTQILQVNVGWNHRAGTVRGLHYQTAPQAEVKIVRCTAGGIFDVIVDLRPDSPTFKRWFGVELSAANHRAIYVPEGFAQGYQALTDGAAMSYSTTRAFAPAHATGVRYNDPAFGIVWPAPITMVSTADTVWADFTA
jgi:dTDP-4-dehydrorhamnose 3,5-epimerase